MYLALSVFHLTPVSCHTPATNHTTPVSCHTPTTNHTTPVSCHTPATSHTVPLCSFLEHHSVYIILPQEKFISQYRANELFSDNCAKYFVGQYHYICPSLSLLFLSSYTVVALSTQMLIQYLAVLLSNP